MRCFYVRDNSRTHALISDLYKYAIQNHIADKDYFPFVVLEKKTKRKKDAFTNDKIETLGKDDEGGDSLTGYILLMIYAGIRFGKLSTITLDNIYMEKQYMAGGIKTDAGRDREIPLCNKKPHLVLDICGHNKKKLLEIHEKVFYNNHRCTLERRGIRKLNPHCADTPFYHDGKHGYTAGDRHGDGRVRRLFHDDAVHAYPHWREIKGSE